MDRWRRFRDPARQRFDRLGGPWENPPRSALRPRAVSGGLSSIGRASDCGSDGCGFDSRRPPQLPSPHRTPTISAWVRWRFELPGIRTHRGSQRSTWPRWRRPTSSRGRTRTRKRAAGSRRSSSLRARSGWRIEPMSVQRSLRRSAAAADAARCFARSSWIRRRKRIPDEWRPSHSRYSGCCFATCSSRQPE